MTRNISIVQPSALHMAMDDLPEAWTFQYKYEYRTYKVTLNAT